MEFEKGRSSFKSSIAVGFLSALLFISAGISIYALYQCSQLESKYYDLEVDLKQVQYENEETTVEAELAAANSSEQPLVRSKRQTSAKTGTTFIHWGRKHCQGRLTELYDGFAAGAYFTHAGGGGEFLCLPLEPEYSRTSIHDSNGWIYGVEYQSYQHGIFPNEAHDKNVPCARCYTPFRAETIMLPAKRTCPEFWRKEYEGYLMANQNGHGQPTNYICVDENPEYIHGSSENRDGGLLYFVQSECHHTQKCPPYTQGGELACVVCTK